MTARATVMTNPVTTAMVELRDLSKSFDGAQVLDRIDLQIRRGEFFSLLGASGSGKSTLLRILAGLTPPDSGTVIIDGTEHTHTAPHRRPVNMMFQSYALFPHLTVQENVLFGLRQDKLDKTVMMQRSEEMLALVKMSDLRNRRPDQLSGGQRQRVALARALAKQPKLLLLDEPMAALDRRLREDTRSELVALQQQVGTTFIMVTHDQEEAMAMSARMAIMDNGRIVQVGAPDAIYERPASRFVAEFIGQANLISGTVTDAGNGVIHLDCSGLRQRIVASADATVTPGTQGTVVLRPEKIRLLDAASAPQASLNRVSGTLLRASYLGDVTLYEVQTEGQMRLRVQLSNAERRQEQLQCGTNVTLGWAPGDCIWLRA